MLLAFLFTDIVVVHHHGYVYGSLPFTRVSSSFPAFSLESSVESSKSCDRMTEYPHGGWKHQKNDCFSHFLANSSMCACCQLQFFLKTSSGESSSKSDPLMSSLAELWYWIRVHVSISSTLHSRFSHLPGCRGKFTPAPPISLRLCSVLL